MKRNVGHVDKLVRMIFAMIFFIMGALYSPFWMALSLVLLFTAVFGKCGIYHLFGWSTCKAK